MHLGIDASNIRQGGGVTHLVEVLRVGEPEPYGISRVTVWGGVNTLKRIEDRPWLFKIYEPLLDRPLPVRQCWQWFALQKLARRNGCDMLFCPGGSYAGSFRPFVAMSQNMLPFEWWEAQRFGKSFMLLRLAFLRMSQTATFLAADGIIFLSHYAANAIAAKVELNKPSTIIPHGVNGAFLAAPRRQRKIQSYSRSEPFRILYVSDITAYKHQCHVAEAAASLRNQGFPVQLDLVGPAPYRPAIERLRKALSRLDPNETFIHCVGQVPHEKLPAVHLQADLFVYASSCENMPNILIEAMASSLPIACSNRGPMPEVLRDAGLYFDPESPEQIAGAVRELMTDQKKRSECAARAYEYAKQYSWERCARDTFTFIADVAN
ncbi:MAG: glycosyltransferase family 4 protein [Syntrophobacteraceae bacterium]